MKSKPEKFTDNNVSLQEKITQAWRDMELAEDLIANTQDEGKKAELRARNEKRRQDIRNMRGEIEGAIDSRARDSR
jgi:uncharacterized protein (DUF2344 family)